VSPIRPQPLIAVGDVEASSRWYGGAIYERIEKDGELILQLHAWEAENHPNLVNRSAAPPGHGVLLWFHAPNFDEAVARVRELGAEIILDVFVNPNARQREIWLKDPDGYTVVIAGSPGDRG
jgi:Glyoxalase/Bleomycin resistance protein/Dioxygenase superfamily